MPRQIIKRPFHVGFALLWSLLSLPSIASASTAPIAVYPTEHSHSHFADSSNPELLIGGDHFCGTDFTSEAARNALKQFAVDKAAGLYARAPKSGSPPTLGEERAFNVHEGDTWIPLSFRLVEITSVYYLWVEIAELNNGNVSQADLTNFRRVALESSPARSIDPTKGFFENNHAIYGLPPNIDGDGIVDLLMYDIGRGFGSTLGYVSPQDMAPPGNGGNARDVLYLDSREGTTSISTLAAIAAHEYTHLIHLSYGWDETFMSEGYAEYAIDFNGYYWRATTYPSMQSEVNQNLFTWRDGGGPGSRDYERAALFVTYLGERVGTAAVGEMLQGVLKKGAAGIDSVLTTYGKNLSDVIRDFHTANFFNDRSIDPRFGFIQPERASHHTSLTSAPINGEVMSTIGEGGYIDGFIEPINSGSVRYRRFNTVANLYYTYDIPISPIFGPEAQQLAYARNSGRLVLKRTGKSDLEVLDIRPSSTQGSVLGRFDWVLFIYTHTNPSATSADRMVFEANWTPLSFVTHTELESVPYEWELESNYPNPFNPQTTVPISLDTPQVVRLEVFDSLGRSIALLHDGFLPPGKHTFHFDGSAYPSGSYLVRLSTDRGSRSRTMTLIK